MTPQELRHWKNGMVADIGDIDALMQHPIIETTPNAAVIVTMTINATLETLAQRMETEGAPTQQDVGMFLKRCTPAQVIEYLEDDTNMRAQIANWLED